MPDYGRPLRFGYFLIPEAHPTPPLELAELADRLGLDHIGIQDHPYQWRFHDTWTLLTAVAMRTSRVSVFPDVASLPLRPPAVLAKAASSLSLLSGGRLDLGLGAGAFWDGIAAMGGPRRTPGESIQALEEGIQVIRLMWSGERSVRFQGRFYQLGGVHPGAAPEHPIGIWLGVYRPRGLALVGRLADGWIPSLGYVKPAELPALNALIDQSAEGAGRDPRQIRRLLNVGGGVTAESLAELALDAGMDTFLLGAGDDPETELRRFAEEVVPRTRQLVEAARR